MHDVEAWTSDLDLRPGTDPLQAEVLPDRVPPVGWLRALRPGRTAGFVRGFPLQGVHDRGLLQVRHKKKSS